MVPINTEEVIKIKKFNYTDIVNDRDIVLVKNVNGSFDKGFFVADNILVVPARYGDVSKDEGGLIPQNKSSHVDNKLYLQSDKDKHEYLQMITRLLNMANSHDKGRKLLNLLTKGEPLYPIKNGNFIEDYISRYVETSTGKKRINVIIQGPGTDVTGGEAHPYITENSLGLANNGIGTASRILLSPKYEEAYQGKCAEPRSSLNHELLHAMHNLFGLRIPDNKEFTYEELDNPNLKTKIELKKVRVEEIMTFGGDDAEKYKDIILPIEDMYLKLALVAKTIGKAENTSKKTDVQNIFLRNLFMLSGKTDINLNFEKSLDVYNVAVKTRNLLFDMTEHKLAKEIGDIFVRPRYLTLHEDIQSVLIPNFLDVYDAQKGFLKEDTALHKYPLYAGQDIGNKEVFITNPPTSRTKPKRIFKFFK